MRSKTSRHIVGIGLAAALMLPGCEQGPLPQADSHAVSQGLEAAGYKQPVFTISNVHHELLKRHVLVDMNIQGCDNPQINVPVESFVESPKEVIWEPVKPDSNTGLTPNQFLFDYTC